MREYIPFIIILTFPIVLFFMFKLIRSSKRLLFILDDKLLKSPIKLSTVLLGVALFYILYSYIIHLIFDVTDPSEYVWNIIGLLVSASHFVKTKGADPNYIILYIFTMLVGLFVYGIFISNLVGYVKERLKKLSKGRTKILEENHILIIGKSEYMYPIIDQYVEASLNNKIAMHLSTKVKRQKIVILSDQVPEKIMNEIEQRTLSLKGKDYNAKMKKKYMRELQNKLIYRTGKTFSVYDLELCNIEKAQSVIVLGSDNDKIKTILSIGATNFKSNDESFVISKFNDREMLDIAERNDHADEYDLIDINHLISSLTTQTTIQPNLSYIYNDLLDFRKTSIEFVKLSKPEYKNLISLTFKEVSMKLDNAVLLGIKNSNININPNQDYIITEDDELIIIKNPKINLRINTTVPTINQSNINTTPYQFVKEDVNYVLVGYGKNINTLLHEFDSIISDDSSVTILVDGKYKSKVKTESFYKEVTYNINYQFYHSFNEFEETINKLDKDNDIDALIILPNEFLSKQQQDDESIFTLQNLKYLERKNNRDYNITVDLVEMSNTNIIEHLNVADIIISDKFSSELIFQYATHRDIKVVYDELFNISGDEIYSIPITNYITDFTKPLTFYTLSEAAFVQNHIAIGYKHSNEVTLLTNDKDKLIEFNQDDHLIVIAKGH